MDFDCWPCQMAYESGLGYCTYHLPSKREDSKVNYFDGETYEADLDHERLSSQFKRVKSLMSDGQERTLGEIAKEVSPATEASVSARLRDLRKPRFGAHTVERRRLGSGLFAYRLVP